MPLTLEEQDIVKKCQGDSGRCVSVKQYCDGIAQCPDASDETQAECTCEDWDLVSCINNNNITSHINCLSAQWVSSNALSSSDFECLDSLHYTKTLEDNWHNDTGISF